MKKNLFLGLIMGLGFSALFAEGTMYKSAEIQKGDAVVLDLFGKRLGFNDKDWTKVDKKTACGDICETDAQVQCYRGFVDNKCDVVQRESVKKRALILMGQDKAGKTGDSDTKLQTNNKDELLDPDGKPIIGPDGNALITLDDKTILDSTLKPILDSNGEPVTSLTGLAILGIGGAALIAAVLAAQGGDNANPAASAVGAAAATTGFIPGVTMNICQTPEAIKIQGARLKELHLLQARGLTGAPIPNTNNPKLSHDVLYASIVADLNALEYLTDPNALQAGLYNLFGKIAVLNGNGKLTGYFDDGLAQGIVKVTQCIYNLGTVPKITAGVVALATAMK